MQQDKSIKRHADAAREYLKLKKVYRYRMKKIEDYRNFEDKFLNRQNFNL